jgi:hypothetical protein
MSEEKPFARTPWNIEKEYDKKALGIKEKLRDWWQEHILSEAPDDPVLRAAFFEELALRALESLSERDHLSEEGADLLAEYLEASEDRKAK